MLLLHGPEDHLGGTWASTPDTITVSGSLREFKNMDTLDCRLYLLSLVYNQTF